MSKELSLKIKNISLFLVVLVVMGHAYNLASKNFMGEITVNTFIQKYISYGISGIAVPLFFSISGYLFFYNFKSTLENWLYKYKSRFKSLVIPFIIWCVGWMIILYLVQLTPFGKEFFKNMIVSKFSLQELFKYTFKYPIPFQLWYISALIKLVVISPLIYYAIKLLKRITVPLIIITWLIGVLDFPIAFFAFGAYLAINNINFYKKVKLKIPIILVSIFMFLLVIKTILSFYQNGDIEILNKIIIAIGIVGCWYIFDYISIIPKNVMNITQYNMFIYLFHEPLQSFIYRIIFRIIQKNNTTEFIFYFIIPCITIIISVIVAYILKKITPKTYRLLVGGR